MLTEVDATGLVVVDAVLDEEGGIPPFELVDIVLSGTVVCAFVPPCPE